MMFGCGELLMRDPINTSPLHDITTFRDGSGSAENLPGGGARAELLAGRGKGASHAAGRQSGGAAPRARARRAAVRPPVEDRHADPNRPDAAELRTAHRPPSGRD